MPEDPPVRLDNVVLALSDALDIVLPYAHDHQQRVAYVALRLGRALGWAPAALADLMRAAALHDIGILSVEEKAESMKFEFEAWQRHVRLGVDLLGRLDAFRNVAEIVRWHHQPWSDEAGWGDAGEELRLSANAVHLADVVDRLWRKGAGMLAQAAGIREAVDRMTGAEFSPAVARRFGALAVQESFWLDFASPRIHALLPGLATWPETTLPAESLEQVAAIFSRIVDFRSRFTATHSVGVAVSAAEIARRMGFGERELRRIRIAGHLHDLGKVCVSNAILEKPARLDRGEVEAIRGHAYYTFRILSDIGGLGDISEWAAYHHERLDGNGYPFHLRGEELSAGSRIMCVADVFTALTEGRPYRKAAGRSRAMPYLWRQARDGGVDGEVVGVLDGDYAEIDRARTAAQRAYAAEYEERFANRP